VLLLYDAAGNYRYTRTGQTVTLAGTLHIKPAVLTRKYTPSSVVIANAIPGKHGLLVQGFGSNTRVPVMVLVA
jgi:hypothetical protein